MEIRKNIVKTIGLLGGMSWESTAIYYRLINQAVSEKLGGLHSASIILRSVDFVMVEEMQRAGDWDAAGALLAREARKIESAGADCLLMCTNTMHEVAATVEAAIRIPFFHIADATAAALCANDIKTAGLLGTAFTMERDFYKKRLSNTYGINVIIPDKPQREEAHEIIYRELCRGVITPAAKAVYLRLIDDLAVAGAQAVILGCTEINLLVQQENTNIPLYDTTTLHIKQAISYALA